MNPDLVNGAFELVGGFALWGNVRRIMRDKAVKGVSPLYTAFFLSWGYWNLYYYPSLDQWWSFWGGLNIVIANTTWLVLMIHYDRERLSGWVREFLRHGL